ncbi:MAG: DUF4412 domain-containing protein [Bacteroidota bacterium]|nr:DUF4412 domain-containing protein [Bacteroidota bacterium]MDP4236062.1 DUF4412 domain-containing protein [Bacteroidota bacterium]
MRHKLHFFRLSLILVCSLFSLPSLVQAQAFEGVITMQMTSPMLGNQKIDMSYTVKGDKVLQTADDPKQGRMSIYTDTKAGTQIIVMEAQKVGMRIDQSTIDSAVKKLNLPKYEPKQTGKTEKIGDYKCELFTMQVDSLEEMDMWLTKDYPKGLSAAIRNCIDAGMKATGVKSDAFMVLFNAGYAPVRIEMKQNGMTQLTNEFAKAEPMKLDDSMFIVPSDIQVSRFDPSHMNPGTEGK